MNDATIQAIHAHALAEYPRECCGLVIVEKGRERYVPCRNQAETPAEHFSLHPADYAAAEDRGEITLVVHSHPDAFATPSQADKVGCEASGLPWLIVSVRDDGEGPRVGGMQQIQPEGYRAPLVGRRFVHGVLDCYSLIRDWYAWELAIELPDFPRTDKWWERGEDLYMRHFREAGCRPVEGPLRHGDIILMEIRTPGVPQCDTNHAAVWMEGDVILHHMYNRLSSRDSYGGYWREVTRLVVRHQEVTHG